MNFLKECRSLWSSRCLGTANIKHSNSDTLTISLHLRAKGQHWKQAKTLLREDYLFLEEECAQLLKQWGVPTVNEAEFHPGTCSQAWHPAASGPIQNHGSEILVPFQHGFLSVGDSWHPSLLFVTFPEMTMVRTACANRALHPGSVLFSSACWPENDLSTCCQMKQIR